MSKADFETIMQVSDVLKGMQTLEKLVVAAPVISLPKDALQHWNELTKKHDEFYELSLNDRLLFAEMGGKPS